MLDAVKELEELSPEEYLWAVCKDPAYFVQYQKEAAAVLRMKGMILIVWKPKYIEYPSIVKFPEFSNKKRKSATRQSAVSRCLSRQGLPPPKKPTK